MHSRFRSRQARSRHRVPFGAAYRQAERLDERAAVFATLANFADCLGLARTFVLNAVIAKVKIAVVAALVRTGLVSRHQIAVVNERPLTARSAD